MIVGAFATPRAIDSRASDAEPVYQPSLAERFGLAGRDQWKSALGLTAAGALLGAVLLPSHRIAGALLGSTLGALDIARVATFGWNDLTGQSGDGDAETAATTAEVTALVQLARTSDGPKWTDDSTLAHARNAHSTNTVEDMREALEGDYDSLEGDVRMIDGEAVMAHTAGHRDGMTFAEWAKIGAASGKMLRMDFKQMSALNDAVEVVEALHIPDDRLTFNVGTDLPTTAFDIDDESLQRLRDRFPNAVLSLNLTIGNGWWVDRVLDTADDVGGPIAIAVRSDRATPEMIETIQEHGVTVNVWNNPKRYSPEDPHAARKLFRERGVDGMIDLRTE